MTNTVYCIDFGSSYTKIARRVEDNDSHLYEHLNKDVIGDYEAPLDEHQHGDRNHTIPSLLVKGRANGKWFTGHTAGALDPNPDLIFCENWKRDLMNSGNLTEFTDMTREFFSGLRAEIGKFWDIEKEALPACRIAVPTFMKSNSEFLAFMTGVVGDSGWVPSASNFLISEPYANLIGLICNGKNTRILREMLSSSSLLAAMRNSSNRVDEGAGFIVIDTGSFTTDIGFVYWTNDALRSSGSSTYSLQCSYKIGLTDCHGNIRNAFSDEQRQIFDRLSFMERERCMKLLTHRESFMSSGAIFGESPAEKHAVKMAIEDFAGKINGALQSFLGNEIINLLPTLDDDQQSKGRDMEIMTIHEVHLTGGAMSIPLLKSTIISACKSVEGWVATFSGIRIPILVKVPSRENIRLLRAGSALGGTSLFIDGSGFMPSPARLEMGAVVGNPSYIFGDGDGSGARGFDGRFLEPPPEYDMDSDTD